MLRRCPQKTYHGYMSDAVLPRYPRGFFFSLESAPPPPSYIPGPLLLNFFVHPWTNVELSGNNERFVIILGHCVSTVDGEATPASEVLLEALAHGEDHFFGVLSRYAGRHAVLFGSADAPKIVTDATGMRAVFYAGEGGVVASHASLVEEDLGPGIRHDGLPFQYGYPGNRTPYLRTKILTPNTYLDIRDNKIRRFWPTAAPAPRSVEEVASECLIAATQAFRNISHGRTMHMALTAGLDSRVILAVALNAGVEFDTYTYGDAKNTLRDRLFAADLAERYNIQHSVVPRPSNTSKLKEHLAEVNYSPHHQSVVGGLMEWFNDPTAIAVSGNLLEIGRNFYRRRRDAGYKPPATPLAMRRLHYGTMDRAVKDAINRYGEARFNAISDLAYQSYIDDTQFRSHLGLLDPFDHFYWEHRMATWHGVALNERDFYSIAFIPFNSRAMFEAMLGISDDKRDDASVFYRMIEMVDPSLLDLPINPKEWPLPVK